MKLPLRSLALVLASTLLAPACGGLPFVVEEVALVGEREEGGVVALPDGAPVEGDGEAEAESGDAGAVDDSGHAADADRPEDARADAREAAGPDGGGGADDAACTPTYVRSNGEGQTFLSCDPPGVYSATSAMEACVAYAEAHDGGAGECAGGVACGANGHMTVFDPNATCASSPAWGYDEAIAGKVTPCNACTAEIAAW